MDRIMQGLVAVSKKLIKLETNIKQAQHKQT